MLSVFWVENPCPDPSNIFESERQPRILPLLPLHDPEDDNLEDLRRQCEASSSRNPVVNFLLQEDIKALRADGITVDDDNDPIPENNPDQTVQAEIRGRGHGGRGAGRSAGQGAGRGGDVSNVLATGTWITPSTCPRRLSGALNREGRWIRHSWEDIIIYDELDVAFGFPGTVSY